MACFLVPAAEAVIVTAVAYGLKSKEERAPQLKDLLKDLRKADTTDSVEDVKVTFSTKLQWLARLLWGGCLLLCYEHIWHGEVVPWFPFLTAASNPADTAVMLDEMRSVGGVMAITVTVVWLLAVLAVNRIVKTKKAAALA